MDRAAGHILLRGILDICTDCPQYRVLMDLEKHLRVEVLTVTGEFSSLRKCQILPGRTPTLREPLLGVTAKPQFKADLWPSQVAIPFQ